MSIYGDFQEIKDNSDIDGSMSIAIASVLKDEFGIKFSKKHFNNCKVMLTFGLTLYDFPDFRGGMDVDIWIMHKFGKPIKEFFKNIISDDTDLYLVDCRYSKGQCNPMSFDAVSVNFYFEYFKQFKNHLPAGPTVYG
jgi:hypothetical protein